MGWVRVNEYTGVFIKTVSHETVQLRQDKEKMGAEGVSELSKVSRNTVCRTSYGLFVPPYARVCVYGAALHVNAPA